MLVAVGFVLGDAMGVDGIMSIGAKVVGLFA